MQDHRCVYCQSSIDADSNGHRELEHILPKSASDDISNAYSNDFQHRRSTNGYPDFTFEPLNLCLSCKVCNPKKGTFDPLIDRTIAHANYPGKGSYLWVHPHFDVYAAHIQINENFTFTKITNEGDAVIKICGLDDARLLAERFLSRARATTSRNRKSSISRTVNAIATDIDQKKYGVQQGAEAFVEKFPQVDVATATDLLTVWVQHLEALENVQLMEKAILAVQVVTALLQKANP